MSQWKNKIVGSAEVNPYALVAHDKNFRTHPTAQKDALAGAIEDIGFIRSVTVNKRTGRILDGHLRVMLALETGQPTIPVEYVDLTEEEELEALATIDPLAALAETDKPKLDELLQQVKSQHSAVTAMLADLAKKNGLAVGESPDGQAGAGHLPPERFEVVVQCASEEQQREMFERLTGEGLRCRVLTF